MSIILLIMIEIIWSSVSSSRTPAIEQVMRDILKKVMKCPEWATDEDIEQPVAAFSPARYMQLVALVRKDSRENSCGKTSMLVFRLNNPRSWNFCGMGVCSSNYCSCFDNFEGEKCNKFQGRCWLFYCRLVGCNGRTPSLHCSCNPSLDGTPLARPMYFYDFGLETNYIPPYEGFVPSAFVDSHIIRQTGTEQFEIIGGNYYHSETATKRYNRYIDGHSYNFPRLQYNFPLQEPDGQNFYKVSQYRNMPYTRDMRKEYYRDFYEESPKNDMHPDSYNKYGFQKGLELRRNKYYNAQSYNHNRGRSNFEDYEDTLQPTSHALVEYDETRYNFPGKTYLTDNRRKFLPQTLDRPQRTGINPQTRTMNFMQNSDNNYLHHSNYEMGKFRPKWQTVEQNLFYSIKKPSKNYVPKRISWNRGNYPSDPRYGSGLQAPGSLDRKLYPYVDNRVRRQKLESDEPSEEQSTIRETWGDDDDEDEEADENEDFSFVSGAADNRFLTIHIILCTVLVIFVIIFLE